MKLVFFVLITISSFTFAQDVSQDRIFGPADGTNRMAITKGCGYLNSFFRTAAKENSYDLIVDPGLDISKVQVCDQAIEFRGFDSLELIDLIAGYYSSCLKTIVDRGNQQIRVSPQPALIHVTSEHKTTNEYAVNGQIVYSFPSSETKDRFICIKDSSVADDWMLKVSKALGR